MTHNDLSIQKLLYEHPLYEVGNNLKILVVGENEAARYFVNFSLQLAMFCGKDASYSITVICDEAKKNDYKKAFSNAEQYLDTKIEKISKSQIDVSCFSKYNYVFFAENELNKNYINAKKLAMNSTNSIIAYLTDVAKDDSESIVAVPVLGDNGIIDEQLERMAFNVHMIWDNASLNILEIRKRFFEDYNYSSSITNALSIKYKLYSIGLEVKENTLEAYRACADELYQKMNDERAVDKMIKLEHDRWVVEKLNDGWQGIVQKDGSLDFSLCVTNDSWKNSKAKCHPCIAKFDELDNISKQMTSFFEKKAASINKENILKRVAQLQPLINDDALFFQYSYAVNSIIYKSMTATKQYDLIKTYIKNKVAGTEDDYIIEKIDQDLFPFIRRNKAIDFRNLDRDFIKNTPFILSYDYHFKYVAGIETISKKSDVSARIQSSMVKDTDKMGNLIVCHHVNGNIVKDDNIIGSIINGHISYCNQNAATHLATAIRIKNGAILDASKNHLADVIVEEIDINTLSVPTMLKPLKMVFVGDNFSEKLLKLLEKNGIKNGDSFNGERITISIVSSADDVSFEEGMVIKNLNSEKLGNLNVKELLYEYKEDQPDWFIEDSKYNWVTYVPKRNATIKIEDILISNDIERLKHDNIIMFDSDLREQFFRAYFDMGPVKWSAFANEINILNNQNLVDRIFFDVELNAVPDCGGSNCESYFVNQEIRANLKTVLSALKDHGAIESFVFDSEYGDCELKVCYKKKLHSTIKNMIYNCEYLHDGFRVKQIYKRVDNLTGKRYLDDYIRGNETNVAFLKDTLFFSYDPNSNNEAFKFLLSGNHIKEISKVGPKSVYKYKTYAMKELFSKEGNILENIVYTKTATDERFDDVIPSCQIRYFNDSGRICYHEIDCVLTVGETILLVECKSIANLRIRDGRTVYDKFSSATERFVSGNIKKCIIHFDDMSTDAKQQWLCENGKNIITINKKEYIQNIHNVLYNIATNNADIDSKKGLYLGPKHK